MVNFDVILRNREKHWLRTVLVQDHSTKITKISTPDFVEKKVTSLESFRLEVAAFSTIGPHPNIIQYYGCDMELKCIFLEYADNGDLSTANINVSRLACVYSEIADGLSFAHAAGVLHRDLKPENIFLQKEGPAKLGDWGSALVVGMCDDDKGTIKFGTPQFIAPETLRFNIYSPETDVWMLGVSLFESVYGKIPWTLFLPDNASTILHAAATCNESFDAVICAATQFVANERCMLQMFIDLKPNKK